MQKIRHSLWMFSMVLAAILFLYPINNLPLRLGLLVFLSGTYAGLLWFFQNRKPVFFGLLAVAVLFFAFLIYPGRTGKPQKLREAYLQSLRSYEGTRFFWGGENGLGVDCSGLIRAGLIKANFQQGFLTLNPSWVRFSLSLWWHDCSAKALGEEYRGQTRRVLTSPNINELDTTKIQPGDIAVTTNGVHVLAFLGDREWIEADPALGKVVIFRSPVKNNPWFEEPVHIMRWTEVETN